MNLYDFKELYINDIKLVELYIDDIKVWAMETQTQGYTNVLPFATDTDRKTIYGGKGYRTGYRLSSSGGGVTATAGMCASGFIPCKVGDVLRIKGTKPKNGTASYVMTFDSNNTKVASEGIGQRGTDPVWISKDGSQGYGCAYYNQYTDILKVVLDSATFGTGWDAIRFSAGVINDSTVVTINEEITPYKNWVEHSTDTDGSIFNGIGYKEDVRLSSSGGISGSAQAGSVTTGFIPWYGDTTYLRMKGVEWLNAHASGHYYIIPYDANKQPMGGYISSGEYSGGNLNHIVAVTRDANGVETVKFSETYGTTNTYLQAFRNAKYIRINAKGEGADMIVTINEEII